MKWETRRGSHVRASVAVWGTRAHFAARAPCHILTRPVTWLAGRLYLLSTSLRAAANLSRQWRLLYACVRATKHVNVLNFTCRFFKYGLRRPQLISDKWYTTENGLPCETNILIILFCVKCSDVISYFCCETKWIWRHAIIGRRTGMPSNITSKSGRFCYRCINDALFVFVVLYIFT